MPRRDKDDPIQPKKQLELLRRLESLLFPIPQPLVLPKESNAVTVSEWPEGYWLLPSPTFFTIQLNERPVKHKDNHALKLNKDWLDKIDSINVGLSGRKWLEQKGTSGVLSEDDNGNIFYPSPQIFGGNNPVKILETWHDFARIQTLDVNNKPPDVLYDWMAQNCGSWKRPKYYRARMLTLFNSNTAWIYLPALAIQSII